MEFYIIIAVIALICLFIVGRMRQAKSGEQREPIDWKGILTWNNISGQRNTGKCRGYVGIAGAVMALVGLNMPFLSFGFIEISYMDALNEASSTYGIMAIVILLIVAFLYIVAYHGVACLISLVLAAFFLAGVLSEDSFGGSLDAVDSGFWAMSAGLILMCTSPFAKKANLIIRKIFTV